MPRELPLAKKGVAGARASRLNVRIRQGPHRAPWSAARLSVSCSSVWRQVDKDHPGRCCPAGAQCQVMYLVWWPSLKQGLPDYQGLQKGDGGGLGSRRGDFSMCLLAFRGPAAPEGFQGAGKGQSASCHKQGARLQRWVEGVLVAEESGRGWGRHGSVHSKDCAQAGPLGGENAAAVQMGTSPLPGFSPSWGAQSSLQAPHARTLGAGRAWDQA
jgi:hypothetical protein